MSSSADEVAKFPTLSDLLSAQERLAPYLLSTPVVRHLLLDQVAGAELWLKAENLQHVGAFKARGAINTVIQLSSEQRAKGLTTYSSGNHAQAVAWVAKRFHLKATIFMPTNAPNVKLAAVQRLGAKVVMVGTTSLERQSAAMEFASESGAFVIEPFDDARTIVGQGTAALELQQEVAARCGGALDQVFVPIGGGGLAAGTCLAFAGSQTEVIGVEPENCNSMQRSLRAGMVVSVEPGQTLADGLRPTRAGELPLAICREYLREVLTVDDAELGLSLVRLLLWAKILVEPSGAAALAAALRSSKQGARVGVILSGGNMSAATLSELLTTYAGQVEV